MECQTCCAFQHAMSLDVLQTILPISIVGWWADWWALGARTRPQGICSQHQSHTSVRLPCHFISQDLIYLLSQCGPWNNSLNLIFPTKSMITKSLKLSHRAESVYVHTSLKIKGRNLKITQLNRKSSEPKWTKPQNIGGAYHHIKRPAFLWWYLRSHQKRDLHRKPCIIGSSMLTLWATIIFKQAEFLQTVGIGGW